MCKFLYVLILLVTATSTFAQYESPEIFDYERYFLTSPTRSTPSPVNTLEPGCPGIANLQNITLKGILGQWHLPFVSKHWVHYMKKSAHGKFTKHSTMESVCIKVNVKELVVPGTSSNFDSDPMLWFQVKCPMLATEWSLACSPEVNLTSKWFCNDLDLHTTNNDESLMNVVDTDGKTWALVVRCFPSNDMVWAIFSKVKKLKTSLVKSLLSKVEDLGFKIFDVIEVPYEKCMTKPQGSYNL